MQLVCSLQLNTDFGEMALLLQILICFLGLMKLKNFLVNYRPNTLLLNEGVHFDKLFPGSKQQTPRRTHVQKTIHHSWNRIMDMGTTQ